MGCCHFTRIEMGEIRISTPINSVMNTKQNLNEENDDFQDISINSHNDSFDDRAIITEDPFNSNQPTLATLRFEILNQLRPRSISNPTFFYGLHSASLLNSKILVQSGTPKTQFTPKVASRRPEELNQKGKHKRSATFSFVRHEATVDVLKTNKSNCKTLTSNIIGGISYNHDQLYYT